MGDVRFVRLEQVHPEEQRAFPGQCGEVAVDLLATRLGRRELHLGVLEVQVPSLDACKARLVDEEYGGRIEGGGAVAVASKRRSPGLGVLAQSHGEERS